MNRQQLNAIYKQNGVGFTSVPTDSLTRDRTFKSHEFISPAVSTVGGIAPAEPLVTTLHFSENEFVDTWSSYIRFSLQLTGNIRAPGLNTLLAFRHPISLIREIRVDDSKGKEIARVESFNKITITKIEQTYNADYLKSVLDYNNYRFTLPTSSTVPSLETVLVIPLYLLDGMFASSKLLPARLMDGAKISIFLEDPFTAFNLVWTAASTVGNLVSLAIIDPGVSPDSTPLDYHVTGLTVITDNYLLEEQLSGMISKEIEVSPSGLPLKYTTHTSQRIDTLNPSGQNQSGTDQVIWDYADGESENFVVDITQSFSNATKAVLMSYPSVRAVSTLPATNCGQFTQNIQLVSLLLDHFTNYSNQATSYRMRIGNFYKPQFAQNVSNGKEVDFLRCVAYNKHKTPSNPRAATLLGKTINDVTIDLSRGVCNFSQNADAQLTDLNTQTSGLRIDFANAAQLYISAKQFLTTLDTLSVSISPTTWATLWEQVQFRPNSMVFIEHCRYIMMKSGENMVLR